MRDTIVELDDQPSDPPRRSADRAAIAGLLTVSVLFGVGVWIARPAMDARLSAPAATRAPASSAPQSHGPAPVIVPVPRGADIPIFLRPTFAPGAPVPSYIVIYRVGPDGSNQIDVPLSSPPEGIRWRAVSVP